MKITGKKQFATTFKETDFFPSLLNHKIYNIYLFFNFPFAFYWTSFEN